MDPREQAGIERVRDEVRLRIVDAKLAALDRWGEVDQVVAASATRDEAAGAVKALLGVEEPWVFHVLDMPVVDRTVAGRQLLEQERAQLVRRLDQRQA